MFNKFILCFLFVISCIPQTTLADDKKTIEVYQLSYVEREPGVDDYEVEMLVSDRFIRLDETGEDSGFIIFDNREKTIFSVSHYDRSVLVIKDYPFSVNDSPVKAEVEYLQLADAPSVSGKSIFNYRVYTGKGDAEETCTDIHLVEGLLPEVTDVLRNYQKVVSGQQVMMTDNQINEMHDPCFYVDQIYNTGDYYSKGLPIQEWHSNERSRILTGYKKVKVSQGKFDFPEDYKTFSIDKDSKTFIK